MGTACLPVCRMFISSPPAKAAAFWDAGATATVRTSGQCNIGGTTPMPLLPLEPFVFPDDLLDQPLTGDATLGSWWVLHTRPRAEKSLARRLLRASTPFFLPLCKRQW